MQRVDAHQHFWHYTETDFGWISDEMATIRRDFSPADLKPLLDAAGVNATVAVQARQSLDETDWLLALADANPWIAGVVGWVPLVSEDIASILDNYTGRANLKGVRHVLQAEPDEYFFREDFHRGLAQLASRNLVYDVLVVERQLPAAIALVDRHPNQRFVLDHIAKPRIAGGLLEPWATQMRDLARRPNITCKLSGVVTEASLSNWTEADLAPYLDTALEAFGPARLMFGSDWPVCTAAASYDRWLGVVRSFLSRLSADEQAMLLGGTSCAAYDLKF